VASAALPVPSQHAAARPRSRSSAPALPAVAVAGAPTNSVAATAVTRAVRHASSSPVGTSVASAAQQVEGVPWSTKVPVPKAYYALGGRIPQVELRGTTLAQLNELAAIVETVVGVTEIRDAYNLNTRITWDTVNMYHIDPNFVQALTLRFKSSFCELVAKSGPQAPSWFVSHWWGTPFKQTVALLNFHAKARDLPATTAHWICTFANNQHDLSALETANLRETPFARALLAPGCVGTVALLDHEVTMLSRAWCVLENFVSTAWAREQSKTHKYDIAAWLPEGSGKYGGKDIPAKPTLRLDHGNGKMKEVVHDEATGGAFPLFVSQRGVRIDVGQAQASHEQDLRNILHCIAGTAGLTDGPPPKSCAGYDTVNHNARQLFAPGAIYAAALRGDVPGLTTLLAQFPECKNAGIGDGATAMHAAAWKGHIEALKFLISAKASVNCRKDEGTTPLLQPATSGNRQVIGALLAAAADPNLARSSDGVAPLYMAAQNNHVEVVQALLKAGAIANQVTTKGAAPLMVAVRQDLDTGTVAALLAGQADPNFRGPEGVTPLRAARRQDVIKLLLEAGAHDEGRRRPFSMGPLPPGAFEDGAAMMGGVAGLYHSLQDDGDVGLT